MGNKITALIISTIWLYALGHWFAGLVCGIILLIYIWAYILSI